MSAPFSGSPAKAMFQVLEGPHAGPFMVQYNPKEFRIERTVEWQEHAESGQTTGYLEFQKGTSVTVTMDLIFDTTCDPPGAQDVRLKWVNGLLVMTAAECQPTDGEQEEEEKQRPPKVLFTWGSFQLTCVVQSLKTTFLLFAADGTPLRARSTLVLKEWTDSALDRATGGNRWAGNALKLVQAKAGATPSSVANETGGDWRDVAQDNALDDPMSEIPAGTDLIVRA